MMRLFMVFIYMTYKNEQYIYWTEKINKDRKTHNYLLMNKKNPKFKITPSLPNHTIVYWSQVEYSSI